MISLAVRLNFNRESHDGVLVKEEHVEYVLKRLLDFVPPGILLSTHGGLCRGNVASANIAVFEFI